MLVSIVIPVFNAEKYLEECLNSALEQTYKQIEIIVVNDGSTDNSLKVMKAFSDKIKIISKSNGGTASALNIGIKAMKGEWFKWLSADDSLYPSAIDELILEIHKLENKKKNILYSNYDIINSEGKKIKQFIEPNYNQLNSFDFNVILLEHYIGNGTTSLIHKSALDEYGVFDETIGFAEDYELWLRFCLIYNCRLHLVPKILARYRVHDTQLSEKKMNLALAKAEEIRKMILNQLEPIQRQKYEIALRQKKKEKPLTIRTRHTLRDIMLKVFPKSVSDKIIKAYFKKGKKYND